MNPRHVGWIVTAVVLVLAFAGLQTVRVASSPPLAPDAYRSPIEWLEEELFTPAPLSARERHALAQAFGSMAQALHGRDRSPLAGDSARKLRALSARSDGAQPLSAAELADLRTRWTSLRSRLFTRAPWFLDAELDVATSAGTLGLRDLQASAQLARAADGLERLARQMKGELRIATDAGEPDAFIAARNADTSEGWTRWGADWHAKTTANVLDESTGETTRPELVYARRELDECAAELHAITIVAQTSGLAPRPPEWRPRVEAALTHARNARRAVALVRRALDGT